jgi:hypothetical protein
MLNLIRKCNNFYEKRDREIKFTVTCSPDHKVFICTLSDLNVLTFWSPANNLDCTQFLAMLVEAFAE